jgi:hypothetical protein
MAPVAAWGTVTFCFGDVKDSTGLLQRLAREEVGSA